MYCRYCGNELTEGDKVCKNCKIEVDYNDANEIEKEETMSNSRNTRAGARIILAVLVVIFVGIVIAFFRPSSDENVGNIENDNENDIYNENDNDTYNDEIVEGEGYIGAGGNWIDEYIEVVDNKNGNTLANLYNDGWVAEHGEWTYMAVRGRILKENTTTGEKVQVYDFQNEDVAITDLSVIGEYVYFKHEEYGLCRMKTNGTEYQYLQDYFGHNVTDAANVAYIYDGYYYRIGKENITASTYEYYLEKMDLDDGTVERLVDDVDEDLRLIGIMDNYAFFRTSYYSSTSGLGHGYNNYIYLKVSLDDYSVKQCEFQISANSLNSVSKPYLANGEIIVFTYEYGKSLQDVYITNFDNESIEQYAYCDRNFEGVDVNFIEDRIIYTQSEILLSDVQGCIMMLDKTGNKTQFVPDEPNEETLCVANGKIYYRYGRGAYRVNFDGTGFEEINPDEFNCLYN